MPALVEQGRELAAAERLPVEFREGDAEALPLPDASFDVVLSTCGHMFAPDQERTAAELLRVCRPGGRVGMVNWTPDSLIAEVFRAIGRHVPPPPGLKLPMLWGSEDRLRELFGDAVASLAATRCSFNFRFRLPEHWLEYFQAAATPSWAIAPTASRSR